MKNTEKVEDDNFSKGLAYGILLSVPLWLSFFGWLKLFHEFLS